MCDITYSHEIGPEDLADVAMDLRAPERADFERTWGSVERALEVAVAHSAEVVKATGDEGLLGLFGVGVDDRGCGVPWLALCNTASRHPFTVARATRDWVGRYLENFDHLSNEVPADDEDAIRLLEFAGFTVRRDPVVLRAGHPYFYFWADRG